MQAQPTNILFITTDQQRWDFFDNRYVSSLQTPNIQRLMREGVTFSNAYSNCPICMPTRFTWLYGLYASQSFAGLLSNAHDWPRPDQLPSMAQALQKAGYRTALIGKLHSMAGLWHRDVVADEEAATRARGFDDVVEVSGKSLSYWYDCSWTRYLEQQGRLRAYRTYLRQHEERTYGWCGGEGTSVLSRDDTMDAFIARNAADWLHSHGASGKPWFLHASFCGPHFPLDALPEYLAHYAPSDMPPPEGLDDAGKIRSWQSRRAHYCALIEHLDAEIGVVLDALEKSGQLETTTIVLTTDHGDMMGHLDRGNKGTAFDTSCRTPVIVRFPRAEQRGIESRALVEAVDVPCAMLELAGLVPAQALPGTPGRSFLSCAKDERLDHRNYVYSECRDWRMCRSQDWKYIIHNDGSEELYNCSADPWELSNQIGDASAQEMLGVLRRHLILSQMQSLPPNHRRHPLLRHDWFDALLPDDFSDNAQFSGNAK